MELKCGALQFIEHFVVVPVEHCRSCVLPTDFVATKWFG
jgi:hypothetical protein